MQTDILLQINRKNEVNKVDIIQSQIEPLLNYFQKVIPLNNEEKKLVTELFKPRLFRKKQYVLQEGDVCNQFNFIVRGCLRMYKVDEKGNTYILQFAAENWWLSNIGSFHERKPSELNIDALEDTMVLQISHDNLLSLYTNAPKCFPSKTIIAKHQFFSRRQVFIFFRKLFAPHQPAFTNTNRFFFRHYTRVFKSFKKQAN
jgi:CRP/FNR family transcriptional regulator, anaerobic regulatory protein